MQQWLEAMGEKEVCLMLGHTLRVSPEPPEQSPTGQSSVHAPPDDLPPGRCAHDPVHPESSLGSREPHIPEAPGHGVLNSQAMKRVGEAAGASATGPARSGASKAQQSLTPAGSLAQHPGSWGDEQGVEGRPGGWAGAP